MFDTTLFPYMAVRFVLLPISCGIGAAIAFKLNAKFSIGVLKASVAAAIVGTVSYLVLLLLFSSVRDTACRAASGDPSLMELCVRFGFGWT